MTYRIKPGIANLPIFRSILSKKFKDLPSLFFLIFDSLQLLILVFNEIFYMMNIAPHGSYHLFFLPKHYMSIIS